MKDKEKILKIMDEHYPELAVMLIKEILTEDEEEPTKKNKILKVINVFETGKIEGDYSKISIFSDGPNNIKQITYGVRQTTEFGNLPDLIKDYVGSNGEFSEDLAPYKDRIGQKPSLHPNSEFKRLLKLAGEDPVMRKCQDKFFDEKYWKRAENWFKENGFTSPLSMLVILDSYVHSGSILGFLRKRFSERPPASGGDERKWIEEYVNTRHKWLATHSSRPILRNTIYRTNCFKDIIRRGDWGLEEPINANGIIVD